jgi:hypothetical protein
VAVVLGRRDGIVGDRLGDARRGFHASARSCRGPVPGRDRCPARWRLAPRLDRPLAYPLGTRPGNRRPPGLLSRSGPSV